MKIRCECLGAHDMPGAEKIITVKCQGCEAECEVSVKIEDGHAICLGGNNCPTGGEYALSLAKDCCKGRG